MWQESRIPIQTKLLFIKSAFHPNLFRSVGFVNPWHGTGIDSRFARRGWRKKNLFQNNFIDKNVVHPNAPTRTVRLNVVAKLFKRHLLSGFDPGRRNLAIFY